jgi:formylglycine-generating enzyme required for sulfatase activity
VTATDKGYPATVADFYLDAYEITVGRFRQFVNVGLGTQATAPAPGTGAHPLITDSGWKLAWNTNLPANTDALKTAMKCNATYQTWTDLPGDNESRPQNCMSWYTAFAFCRWDGGRLPTEAEWNYAAAGGSEQREYPWGSGIDASQASYYVDPTLQCMGDGTAGCSLADFIIVGSKPAGNGKWGHADLAGNVREWTLDWFAPYQSLCRNCADLMTASNRVVRGGGFRSTAADLGAAVRSSASNAGHDWSVGARCARSNLP